MPQKTISANVGTSDVEKFMANALSQTGIGLVSVGSISLDPPTWEPTKHVIADIRVSIPTKETPKGQTG